ncbi:hypothetical protein O988_07809, partial [Pseudogymnoascus sp. VKM F-3808]
PGPRPPPQNQHAPLASRHSGALRAAQHVQPVAFCEEAAAWVFVAGEDAEGEGDAAEEEEQE